MKGFYKYIGAVFGFFMSGYHFFGAFAGYIVGSIIDAASVVKTTQNQAQGQRRYHSSQDIFDYYQRQTQQYDFPTMLLALSAVVMKADGKALRSELDFVKTYLRQQFGNQFTNAHLQTLKTFIEQPQSIPLQQICQDISMRTRPEVRVQLLHYLFGIAKADGTVSPYETNTLNRIASLLGISGMDFTSVQNMYQRNTDSDFKILGLSQNATDDEVKKAYRKMAIRYHPDKVAHMGEEYQKGAKEKFLRVQEAYENIKKERQFA